MKNKDNLSKPKPSKEKRPSLESYGRYSGMAFEMFAIIGLGIFAGIKLDQWLNMSFPLFTVLFSLISLAGAIYNAIKDLLKRKP